MNENFKSLIRILALSIVAQVLIWVIYSQLFGHIEAIGGWQYWAVAFGIMMAASLGMGYSRDRNLELFIMIFLGGFSAEAVLHATSTYANPVFKLPMWMRIFTLALTAFVLLLVFFRAKRKYGINILVVIALNFLFAGINSFCDYNIINLIRSIL